MKMNAKNAPLNNSKSMPLVLEGRNNVHRSYTNSFQISQIAIEDCKKHGCGITYISLLNRGIAKTKRQAQNILKYHLRQRTLFTISDKRPQAYYPSCLRSEIFKKELEKNTPQDPIGVSLLTTPSFTLLGGIKSKHPLSQCLEYMAYYTLEGYVLPLLIDAPLLVHNLHFKTRIASECYSELKLPSYKNNHGKYHEEIIGKTKVDYVLYASGTVVVHTTCSNYPYKVETEEDRLKLVSWYGQIRAGLIQLLKDKHERIVPDISEWEVTECDFNKDIKISNFLHMTALKIRIKHLHHLFGIYVKVMGQDTVLRVEETKHPNVRFVEFITETFNPMAHIQSELFDQGRKISEIYDIITKSSVSYGSTNDGEVG